MSEYFVRASTLREAVAAIKGADALFVAGGTSVALLLKNRLIEPERLVWLGGIAELGGITTSERDGIVIGATTTLREIVRSPLVEHRAPVLATAAHRVGNPRVRAIATLGGAVAHGDPRQDLPPVLLALRSTVDVTDGSGERSIPIDAFFLGFMETALSIDEIVTRVRIPSRLGWRDAYSRFTPASYDDYPTVGVAASVYREPGGTISDAVIALGGVGQTAISAEEAAHSLVGTSGARADRARAAEIAAATCDPGDDQRGSADYKRAMVAVWVERTLARCLAPPAPSTPTSHD